jgi:uncharacterized 2Fe-2S/4Fe-4S cluster protein (DUF4445 family)
VSAGRVGEKHEVVFEPFGKRASVAHNTPIMDAARELMIDVSTICGERGTCGKCKVRVDSGVEQLGPLKPAELRHLLKDQIDGGYRLACVCKVRGPLVIWVPDFSRQGKQRLQTEGLEVPVNLNSPVRKYFVRMHRASLEDSRGDDLRLLEALKEQHGLQVQDVTIDFDLMQRLAEVLREAAWEVTAVVWDDRRIIAVEAGDTSERKFGFAMDIGSTKLAGFLMDLATGKVQAVAARMNPQIAFGDEIMSRLTYAMKSPESLKELQAVLFASTGEMIEECCGQANVRPSEIYECLFVGNSAMEHILLGLRARNVGFAPYAPCFTKGLNISTRGLPRLGVNPGANIYISSIIGGQIGGDSVGDLLVARLLDSDDLLFDIDIGTNTELAVGNKDRVVMCSVPSGPAFEGMQIRHGMRAATGAIEKVSIDPSTLEVWYRAIDDVKPIGICGSALIDIPAELLKAGLIETRGRFNTSLLGDRRLKGRLRKGSDGMEFVLAWEEESGIESDVVITEGDIRALAMAKGAMRTGAAIIMKRRGVTEGDLAKVFVAGAFGNYVDPESARTIGMFPEVPIERVVFVGNSAGTGARMMLISKEARRRGEEIAQKVERIELALEPDFPVEYAKAMYFPHMNLDLYPITKEMLLRLGRISAASPPASLPSASKLHGGGVGL